MPIFKKPANSENQKADLKEGKPSSLSIAMSVQRKNKKKKMADGGMVDSSKKSLGEIIGYPGSPSPKPAPKPMAMGGSVADAIMSKIKRDMDGDQVDIESNNQEQPNEYYDLNEDALDHSFDADMEDQPMDSNEKGHEIDSDSHDMVSVLRKRIKSRRGF